MWFNIPTHSQLVMLDRSCRLPPRQLLSDAYERISVIPTVPIYYLAKSQPRKRALQNQRGKKTLLSLALV